ncbi:hypothetical protein PS726_05045 [Pseudomonas fluorescens]|uniref:Uncharacterized protein n=1 Tax=Pseudomonas fluorescens TaxID=294 RepID=A0A8H2NWV4_PSEFL|nr:hypothetical protein PS861_01595 [Pseudomonas fluorescens]VVO31767.1 hypothetical protein PS726_05045 [Pseudomonas fluorescens]VVO56637.1 hypothetical protein PS900_00575 [Pseudomonas fluorescens]VVP74229.1 hypothetical protein PS934_00056 [Pseudomonas fluorescens]
MTPPEYPGELNTVPVGASLLAIAEGQSPVLLNVPQSSRAGSLPHWVFSVFR